jgi:hypothetical protein
MSAYSIELYQDAALKETLRVDAPIETARALAHEAVQLKIADFARVIHRATGRERWAERRPD